MLRTLLGVCLCRGEQREGPETGTGSPRTFPLSMETRAGLGPQEYGERDERPLIKGLEAEPSRRDWPQARWPRGGGIYVWGPKKSRALPP